LQKYRKIKDIMSHLIFETDVGEKKSSVKNTHFCQKKQTKKNFCKAILPVLTASP